MNKKPMGLDNDEVVHTFMHNVEQKFSDLLAKIEDTIIENAENLTLISSFSLEGSELDRDEQIKVLITVSRYFAKKGFGVSDIKTKQDDDTPYIIIEVLI